MVQKPRISKELSIFVINLLLSNSTSPSTPTVEQIAVIKFDGRYSRAIIEARIIN